MDDFKPRPSSCKEFVSEAQLEERRKRRQEEWEKIRRDDQPLECPEEEYDPRSLYERLQEQKRKREEEFEESKKLKHLIRGLDNDELSFLELVDKSKLEEESLRKKEETDAINELKSAVVVSAREEQEKMREDLKRAIKSSVNQEKLEKPKKSQASLLASVVKPKTDAEKSERTNAVSSKAQSQTIRCIGILPGIVPYYSDSSDSDNSSNSDSDDLQNFKLLPYVRVSDDSGSKNCRNTTRN
ncbi:protein FAM192A-like isoform X2 [Dinothrombium tinctorium]|uniref:Protein FAM192A-like isoform X2 n=1 Tax=Dinothrombium tinctorium TaxID=1965070 RepID=A0A3S3P5Z5_9ACAR|nr:protein FAM192A-like isoform X2 [Dinothrombium tinctorium]RWS12866.1 protein FAM192A-like isoform X2 [Dinothrombium tinctorium]